MADPHHRTGLNPDAMLEIIAIHLKRPTILHQDDIDPGNPGMASSRAAAPPRSQLLPTASFRSIAAWSAFST
nr:hypothetical protein [Rhizobium rhizogenes]